MFCTSISPISWKITNPIEKKCDANNHTRAEKFDQNWVSVIKFPLLKHAAPRAETFVQINEWMRKSKNWKNQKIKTTKKSKKTRVFRWTRSKTRANSFSLWMRFRTALALWTRSAFFAKAFETRSNSSRSTNFEPVAEPVREPVLWTCSMNGHRVAKKKLKRSVDYFFSWNPQRTRDSTCGSPRRSRIESWCRAAAQYSMTNSNLQWNFGSRTWNQDRYGPGSFCSRDRLKSCIYKSDIILIFAWYLAGWPFWRFSSISPDIVYSATSRRASGN